MPLSLGFLCKKCRYRGHQASDCDQHCRWCQNIRKPGHYNTCARAPDCQQCGQRGHTDFSCQEEKWKRQDSEERSKKPNDYLHRGSTFFSCREVGQLKSDYSNSIPTYLHSRVAMKATAIEPAQQMKRYIFIHTLSTFMSDFILLIIKIFKVLSKASNARTSGYSSTARWQTISWRVSEPPNRAHPLQICDSGGWWRRGFYPDCT